MAKYQGLIPYSMDEAIYFMDQCLTGGTRTAVLRETEDLRTEQNWWSIRLYEQFDFPSAEQSALCLMFTPEAGGTRIIAIGIGTGRLTYFGRDENLPVHKGPYLLELVKETLMKYDVKEAG